MKPHWVNICERAPDKGKEVQVLVVHRTSPDSCDIGYGKAKLTVDGWLFSGVPEYTNLVAWLESDRSLSRKELSDVAKDCIRF